MQALTCEISGFSFALLSKFLNITDDRKNKKIKELLESTWANTFVFSRYNLRTYIIRPISHRAFALRRINGSNRSTHTAPDPILEPRGTYANRASSYISKYHQKYDHRRTERLCL